MTVSFPKVTLSGSLLQYVKAFKCLGHMIMDTLSADNDNDIQRKIRKFV